MQEYLKAAPGREYYQYTSSLPACTFEKGSRHSVCTSEKEANFVHPSVSVRRFFLAKRCRLILFGKSAELRAPYHGGKIGKATPPPSTLRHLSTSSLAFIAAQSSLWEWFVEDCHSAPTPEFRDQDLRASIGGPPSPIGKPPK